VKGCGVCGDVGVDVSYGVNEVGERARVCVESCDDGVCDDGERRLEEDDDGVKWVDDDDVKCDESVCVYVGVNKHEAETDAGICEYDGMCGDDVCGDDVYGDDVCGDDVGVHCVCSNICNGNGGTRNGMG